jgi:hypothetical protein
MTRPIALVMLALMVFTRAAAQDTRSMAEKYPGAVSSVKRLSGESVVPVFDGWQRNTDGSFDIVFGYFNRNFEEQLEVPLGPQNNVGGGDKGQPTHFYPRRNKFVFRVRVPKDFDRKQRIVWTLVTHGKTEVANGWLIPEMEIDEMVISQNMSGGIPDPDNKAPAITGVPATRTATVGSPLALSGTVSDDWLPKPPKVQSAVATGGRMALPLNRGLRVKWLLYRGSGAVTFQPQQAEPVYGAPVTLATKVVFAKPGQYVLRLLAGDGSLESFADVTVDVKSAHSSPVQ